MNVKAVSAWVGLWLVGAVGGLILLVGVTIAYDKIADPQEDTKDIMLNCYVYGDGDCGPNAPWHGYINI